MTAEQTYQQEYAECMELIKALKVNLALHRIEQTKTPIDWGNVGDLVHLKMELKETIKFITR
jgi:hypothetical protein